MINLIFQFPWRWYQWDSTVYKVCLICLLHCEPVQGGAREVQKLCAAQLKWCRHNMTLETNMEVKTQCRCNVLSTLSALFASVWEVPNCRYGWLLRRINTLRSIDTADSVSRVSTALTPACCFVCCAADLYLHHILHRQYRGCRKTVNQLCTIPAPF